MFLRRFKNYLTYRRNTEKLQPVQRVPKAVNRLLDCLFASPIISISELSKTWKMPFPTVQRGVDYLVEKGILGEITGGQRNRLFVANEILNAIMTERTKSMNRQTRTFMGGKMS